MTSTNNNSAAGSNNSSAISPSPADADADQSKLLAKITIGTRLDIYWPDDDVYYPATVARHLPNETQQHVYTIDYDDGERDDLDLATEQFHILGLLSAAAAASSSPRKPTNFTSNNGSYNLKLKPPTLPPGKTEITQPCPEIGEGWTQQVVARSNYNSKSSGRSKSCDRYFHSPDGTKFRSMAEVNRFLNGQCTSAKSPARGPFKSPIKNGKSHDTKKAKGIISSRSKSPTKMTKAIAIGTRIEIYWPGDEVYYPGTVAAHLPNELQQYVIDYDDGESHIVDMAAERFRILDGPVASSESSNDEKMSDGNGSVDQMRTSDESENAGVSKKRPFDSMTRDQDTDDGACLTAPNGVPGGTDAIMQRMLSQITGMDALIQKMISYEVQNVQQQMDDRENAHKEELQKMRAKLNQAEDQNSKLKETNDKLSQELMNAREEISAFGFLEEGTCRNPREGSRIQQLALIEKKLTSSNKKVDTLKKDIHTSLGNYEELKPKVEKSKEQVESTKKLLQDMENMVETMKSESNNDGVDTSVDAMNNAVIELKQELKRNDDRVKTLGDDLYKEKKAWNDRSKEHNKLRKEITEMKDKREVLRELTETTLTIGYPKWSYSVGQAIATLVEPNDHMLKSLRLSDITLNDDDVISLAKSLGNNTNLKLLAVDPQSITPVGLRAMIGALFDVSCLNDCVWSNHTCQVKGLGYRYDINKYDTSTNRVMKIFTILARKEKEMLDMDCLSGVPIELIPKLLSMAQKFTERTPELGNAHVCLRPGEEVAHWKHTMCGDKKSLTCVFEILRCLALPSLFAWFSV